METILIPLLALSLSLTVVLAFLLSHEKKRKNKEVIKEISIQYMDEIDTYKGFFKNQNIVRIKAQILYNGLPIGPSFCVCEHKDVEIDKKQINESIRLLAEPLIQAGMKAILPY